MCSFLWLSNIPLCICTTVDGHLGCFHVLAFVNSVAMNNGMHVSFSVLVSSGYIYVGVGLQRHMVVLFLVPSIPNS